MAKSKNGALEILSIIRLLGKSKVAKRVTETELICLRSMKGYGMTIRNACESDVEAIMNIFASAKEYMDRAGNTTQWEKGYPNQEILETDISNRNCYVFVESGTVVGTFSFLIGDEPTYHRIENGQWHQDKPYGTIHRLASNGTVRGIAKACFTFCSEKADYIRIDTHVDNATMQKVIRAFGFQECGVVYVKNGSKRIAFDYSRETGNSCLDTGG